MTLLGHSTLPTTPDIKYCVRKMQAQSDPLLTIQIHQKKSIRNGSVRPG